MRRGETERERERDMVSRHALALVIIRVFVGETEAETAFAKGLADTTRTVSDAKEKLVLMAILVHE